MTSQKSVLITGCSSGIGLFCAEALHKDGYRVIASARSAKDVTTLKQKGLTALQLDITNSESISQAVEAALEISEGNIYGLFNNAGYGQPGAVEDLERDVLRANFETNVFGTHELSNKLIPHMRRKGEGRIIQNSSVLGFVSMPYRGAYNATKFALEGLSDALRLELSGSGIYVSLIEPGPITSNFRKNALDKFHQNINIENSAHSEIYQGMLNRLNRIGPKAPGTLGPDAVYAKLLHALESKNPRPRYYVTWPTGMFGSLKRILSTRMLDKVLIAISHGENK